MRRGLERLEGTTSSKVKADRGQMTFKAADDVEHEHAIGDRFVQITECISNALEVPTIICDGEVMCWKYVFKETRF